MSKRDEAQSLQLAFSLHRGGKFDEAAKLYRKIIKWNPREADALHSLGLIEAANGNRAEAARLMARSLSVRPANIQFMQNYASVLCLLGEYETAAGVSLKGLQLDGSNVYLMYICASALFKQGRLHEALLQFDKVLLHQPNHIAAITERTTVLLFLKQYDAARAGIEKAIAIDPQYADAHLNGGILYAHLHRHDEAIVSFDRALRLNPHLETAWLGRGNVLLDLKLFDEAFAAFDRALSLNPVLESAWVGRGNVLFELKRYGEALEAYDRAIRLKSDCAEAWLGCGNVFSGLRRDDEAITAYDKALSFKSDLATVHFGRGNVLFNLKRFDEAVAAYDRARSIDPDMAAVAGMRIHAKMHLCDWTDIDTDCDDLVQSVRHDRENNPFVFLGVNSSVEDQFASARLWVRKQYPPAESSWRGERYRHDKIRIGYVSADFRAHPVANLVAGVFECHDRSQFEVTGISIGPDDRSEMRRRLESSFDTFVDAVALGSDELTKRIRQQEIDILIDLQGFTQNARTEIFARRPAPVQVNYLGYPGTMGASYIDYIVGDPILVPASHQSNYSEKIVYLPDSYQPNDSRRAISDRTFTKAECGLPDTGFIFCCFNNNYKITPGTFDTWMRILKSVEGSVLWLFCENAASVANVRKEAAARGIDPARLVFAERMQQSDHLARHRVADLVLDTMPYNAHTTASDALWAGLPVLTQIGATFAGRVAASLLSAIGLPELITQTPDQFEKIAIELATEPSLLAAIKKKLAQNRSTKPLFDTKGYTRHLESAYAEMYRRSQEGLPPDHIHVAA